MHGEPAWRRGHVVGVTALARAVPGTQYITVVPEHSGSVLKCSEPFWLASVNLVLVSERGISLIERFVRHHRSSTHSHVQCPCVLGANFGGLKIFMGEDKSLESIGVRSSYEKMWFGS